MSRFGIFVTMAGRQAGGPETYEHSLVRELAAVGNKHQFDIFCLGQQAAQSFKLERENVKFHVLRSPSRLLTMGAILPVRLMRTPISLLHATFVPPPFSPKQYVFTMHDTGMFAHPEFYHPSVRIRLNGLLKRGVSRAARILCVSETARSLVSEQFKIHPDRTVAVHNGVSDQFRPLPADETAEALARKFGLRAPYVLFVGQLKLRSKNIIRLLEGFARFRQSGNENVRLVLAGRRPTHEPYSPTLLDEEIERLKLKEHILELGHVADEDLPLLYNGAEVFLFPTLWEGFGLPVVEAMACGTPVITSNVSCLPEVAGDAAVFVNPHSVDEIAAALDQVFNDEDLRQSLREKGLARAAHFTWKSAAQKTLHAYEEAISG